jgi:hypothetical protein
MLRIIRRSAAVATLAFAALAGACGSEIPTAPTSPPRDGGLTFGSGARASDSPPNTTAAADSGSTATNRGGGTFGSGA